MKLKSSVVALGLAVSASMASAALIAPTSVSGSFSDKVLATITVPSLSGVIGEVLVGTGTVFFGSTPFTLSPVSFSSVTLGGHALTDFDPVADGFQFILPSLAAGTYTLEISGVTGGLGLVAGDYILTPPTITPSIPEPQSAALLLAGMGAIGVVTRRRRLRR